MVLSAHCSFLMFLQPDTSYNFIFLFISCSTFHYDCPKYSPPHSRDSSTLVSVIIDFSFPEMLIPGVSCPTWEEKWFPWEPQATWELQEHQGRERPYSQVPSRLKVFCRFWILVWCLIRLSNHFRMLSDHYVGGVFITLSYTEETKFYNDQNSNNYKQNAESKSEDWPEPGRHSQDKQLKRCRTKEYQWPLHLSIWFVTTFYLVLFLLCQRCLLKCNKRCLSQNSPHLIQLGGNQEQFSYLVQLVQESPKIFLGSYSFSDRFSNTSWGFRWISDCIFICSSIYPRKK